MNSDRDNSANISSRCAKEGNELVCPLLSYKLQNQWRNFKPWHRIWMYSWCERSVGQKIELLQWNFFCFVRAGLLCIPSTTRPTWNTLASCQWFCWTRIRIRALLCKVRTHNKSIAIITELQSEPGELQENFAITKAATKSIICRMRNGRNHRSDQQFFLKS